MSIPSSVISWLAQGECYSPSSLADCHCSHKYTNSEWRFQPAVSGSHNLVFRDGSPCNGREVYHKTSTSIQRRALASPPASAPHVGERFCLPNCCLRKGKTGNIHLGYGRNTFSMGAMSSAGARCGSAGAAPPNRASRVAPVNNNSG